MFDPNEVNKQHHVHHHSTNGNNSTSSSISSSNNIILLVVVAAQVEEEEEVVLAVRIIITIITRNHHNHLLVKPQEMAAAAEVPTQRTSSNLLDRTLQLLLRIRLAVRLLPHPLDLEVLLLLQIRHLLAVEHRLSRPRHRRLEEQATRCSNSNNRNKWDRRPLEHFRRRTRTAMRTHLHLVVAVQRHLLHRLVQATTTMPTHLLSVRVTTTPTPTHLHLVAVV